MNVTGKKNSRSHKSVDEPPKKRPRKEQHNVGTDVEIDTNVCYLCFGLYQKMSDWIDCGCGCWVHEECV